MGRSSPAEVEGRTRNIPSDASNATARSRALVRVDRLNAVAIAMLSLFLAITAIGSAAVVRAVIDSNDRAERALMVREMARAIFGRVQAAERGQRGYLITENRAYLTPFVEAEAGVSRDFTRLINLIGDDPDQAERLERLRELVDARFSEIRRSLAAAEAGDFASARSVVEADIGYVLTGEIETVIEEMTDHETAALLRGRHEAAMRTRALAALVSVSLALTVALAVLSVLASRRTARQASAQSDRLDLLNRELEARVTERTRDLAGARDEAERERGRVELLLRDLNHRVGNNLAMISALLGMQAAKIRDEQARAALMSARERVFLIGSAQRRLKLKDDLHSVAVGPLLSAVIGDILDAIAEEARPALFEDYEDVSVDSRDAATLAVVAGELITNALKHAYRDISDPRIWVSFKKNDEEGFVLRVEDNGRGWEGGDADDQDGLGTLVLNQFSKHFGGEIARTARQGGGLTVTATLPRLEPSES